MKVLIASLFLMGFMSCSHHHGHGDHHEGHKHQHGEKCADGSCDLKGKKDCCKKEKKAES